MPYIGTGGQFDAGLTNPSRRIPNLGWAMGAGAGGGKPAGTKPMPITPPITGGGGVPSPGGVNTAAPSVPAQSTDQYWPWPTTPGVPAPATGVNPGNNGIPMGSGGLIHDPNKPELAPYGEAPPIPGGGQTAGPITGAAPGGYVGYNPTLWEEPDIAIPEAGVNTRDVVESTRHFLDEEMAGGMADAARRFGALGGLKGTGYAATLGEKQRKRDLDLASKYYEYDYNAAQADANRKSAAREGTLGRAYGAWGQTEGLRAGEADRRTGYNVGQQDRADAISKINADLQNQGVGINNQQDWNEYFAGLSEAERKQLYDQMLLDYGG